MQVFVTGATGFVGTQVVKELQKAGHTILGLVRSEESAQKLEATGAKAVRGTLTDLDILKKSAVESDGVIHLGFVHDFTKFEESCAIDFAAIEAIGTALEGSGKPFINTSGTLGIRGDGVVATEDDKRDEASLAHGRAKSEIRSQEFASSGVRAMVICLPPSTHGDGDKGFVPMLTKVAREKGESGYIGEGTNVWPSSHVLDAAVLYRLVLEKGIAGSRYHAIHDQAVATKDIAAVIGRKLGVPVVSKSAEEAAAHFGFMSWPLSMNSPASGDKTQKELGWTPTHSKLLEDLEKGTYFM